jgi:O-antigen/teichoic acid export membrane protein
MYARILKLAGHGAVYGLGSIASKVIAIVMLPIIIRYLPPKSYGIAETVLMINLFTAALFRLGLQNAMMRFFYDTTEDERDAVGVRVVRTSLALTLISMAVGSLVLYAFAHPLAQIYLNHSRRDEFIWLAALGMVTSVLYSTLTATFRLEQRPGSFLWVSLGNVVLSSVLSLYFITSLKWGVEGLLLGNFLGYLGLVPVAALMQRRYALPWIDRTLVKPMLRFALPTIPIAVAFQALTLIDRTIISRNVGLEEVGLYGLASRFSGVVLIAVTALQLSWQPFAYSIKDDDEARRSYAIVTSWFAAGMGWMVSGMALLADPVVRWMTVPAYYDAAWLVPPLALAAGVYGAYFLVGIGASRVKRTGWHIAVAVGAVAVSLAANLALVPIYGARGAAISAVCANGALAGFMLLRSQRVFHVDYELARLLRPVLLTGLAIAGAYLLPTGTGSAAVVLRIAIALGWPLVLVATGFVSPPERERIIRLVRRRSSGATPA